MSNWKNESSRCLHCKNAQCRVGCPVGYDIPTFLEYCNNGQFENAVGVVGHLFGEVCGYVCPRDKQCKGHCILGKRGVGLDVGVVERTAFAENFPQLTVTGNALMGKRIAVVGGGVSGVTFAEQCYRNGANVVIYEKNQLLHTLRSIPSFRLPKDALLRITAAIQNSAINVVKQNVDSVTLQNLLANNDAVYLATGVMIANKMRVEGENYATLADDFLRGNNFGDVIVVGGGNTAMDCARLNARNGGKTTVAYRRSREDMPAFPQEIAAAEGENVQFCFHLAPISIQKQQNALAVTFAKTVSEGRGRLALTNETVTMLCDSVVVATGNGFDTSVYQAEKYVTVDANNCVCGNLYAGGDATGKNLVAEAVFDALNASRALLAKYKR